MRHTVLAVMTMTALAAGAAGAGATPAAAQVAQPVQSPSITFSGQLRPRTEMRDTPSRSDALTTMRARFDVRGVVAQAASVFVQLQDVRMWGDESSTVTNSDRIELHQGFIDLGLPKGVWSARVGRQEMSYGEERLVGAADWIQQARSFDGVRGRWTHETMTADVFVNQIADIADADKSVSERFLGTEVQYRAGASASIEGYALHNSVHATLETQQTTAGSRITGAQGRFSYRAEGAIQRGTRVGANVDALMAAGRATLDLTKRASVTLWYDYLSGDDAPVDGTVRVFDTLYGTNHKFYGTADLFTNIPLHTGGRGLQDAALKTAFIVRPDVTVNVDGHLFNAAAGKGLASTHFGNEVDVNGVYRYSPKLSFNAGASYFGAGDGMAAIGRPIGNQAFGYVMLNATF